MLTPMPASRAVPPARPAPRAPTTPGARQESGALAFVRDQLTLVLAAAFGAGILAGALLRR